MTGTPWLRFAAHGACDDMAVSPIVWQPLGLIALNFYAVVLVLLRGPIFHTKIYRPMLLNIFLSLVPGVVLAAMAITLYVAYLVIPTRAAIWAVLILGGLVWLLMLPNSAYLITELNLSHRKPGENVPIWYDIVLVLTLALSGTLNTLTNVAIAQVAVAVFFTPNEDVFGAAVTWLTVIIVLLLVAFGIYLGRNIRLNSWDFLHPASLFRKVKQHFWQPGAIASCLGFVVAHFILLGLLYGMVVVPVLGQIVHPT